MNRASALASTRRLRTGGHVRVAVIGYAGGQPWGPCDYLTAADNDMVQVIGFDVTGVRRGEAVECRGPYDVLAAATRYLNSATRSF